MLGRYGDGPRVETVCKGYSGSPVNVNRMGRQYEIPRPLITQIFAVQPAVLRSIIENRAVTERAVERTSELLAASGATRDALREEPSGAGG